MRIEDLQDELDVILAYKLFKDYQDYSKCLDWAISLMDRDISSDYLNILAGLDVEDSYSIDLYFDKLIDDLSLIKDKTKEDLFLVYITDIAQQVILKKLDPKNGLNILDGINYSNLDFSTQIIKQFSDLLIDISLLDDYFQMCYVGLSFANIDEAITNEMNMLLLAIDKGLDNIVHLIYCKECNEFNYKKYKNLDPLKENNWVCNKCDSTNFLDWTKINDQQEILALIENYKK